MKSRQLIFAVVLCLAAVPVLAQETGETEQEDPLWSGSLGLAYLGTSGNSETSTFGLDFTTTRKPTPWGLEITGRFTRNEDDNVLTAERYFLGARALRSLGDRWQLFGGLSGERDEFAGFTLLTIAEAGVTYKALIGPTHHLSFDAGLTWTDENRVEPQPDVDYMGAVLGLDYEWKISDNASFLQSLDFYPNFDESSDWRLNSNTALQAAVNSWLALKLGYEVRYRNEPIGDNEDTDTTSTASVVFTF